MDVWIYVITKIMNEQKRRRREEGKIQDRFIFGLEQESWECCWYHLLIVFIKIGLGSEYFSCWSRELQCQSKNKLITREKQTPLKTSHDKHYKWGMRQMFFTLHNSHFYVFVHWNTLSTLVCDSFYPRCKIVDPSRNTCNTWHTPHDPSTQTHTHTHTAKKATGNTRHNLLQMPQFLFTPVGGDLIQQKWRADINTITKWLPIHKTRTSYYLQHSYLLW